MPIVLESMTFRNRNLLPAKFGLKCKNVHTILYNWVSSKLYQILNFTTLRFTVGTLLENGSGYLVSCRIGFMEAGLFSYNLNIYVLININFNGIQWSLEEVCDHEETVGLCSQCCCKQSLGLDFGKNVKIIACLSLVINIQIELHLHVKSSWEAYWYFYHCDLKITSSSITSWF